MAATPSGNGPVSDTMFRSVAIADPSAVASPSVAPLASTSSCIDYGGIRVQICDWINYDYYISGGFKYVSISSVQNSARKIDIQASLAKLSYTAYQLGQCGIGCTGTLNHQKSGSVTPPASGTVYTMSTGWAGQYQRVTPGTLFDIAGDKETLNYNWRGSSLSLFQQFALQ